MERITDNYNKEDGSNVHKFWQLVAEALQEDEQLYFDMLDSLDVDKARGLSLDRIGQKVGQTRGALTDDVYLVMVKSKIKRTLSDGSLDTIIDILSFLLDIPKDAVKVTELWEQSERNKVPSINSGEWEINDQLTVLSDYVGFTEQPLTWRAAKDMKWSDMK